MSTPQTSSSPMLLVGRYWPELAVLLLAALVFLLPLGAAELWDRREEHIAADAMDTLRFSRWLVVQDHGLPRLQKPPLARWLAAWSIQLTGRRDEFAVRLPAGLAALATTILIYFWGRRLAQRRNTDLGRTCGLAAALLFLTNFLVISEMWVMSCEPILTLCVSLALWCYWLADEGRPSEQRETASHRGGSSGQGSVDGAPTATSRPAGQLRYWSLLAAAGSAVAAGLLTKGPVVVEFVVVAIAGYLLCTRPLREWTWAGRWQAWRALAHVAFWLPALLPPLVWVLWTQTVYPEAWSIWLHEIKLKTIGDEQRTALLLKYIPMTAPWLALGVAGAFLPLRQWPQLKRSGIWLTWWWGIGNLLAISTWKAAREPYFLACMPAIAILGGIAWALIADECRQGIRRGQWFRFLDAQWITWAVLAAAIPIAAWSFGRSWMIPALLLAMLGLTGFVLGWRRRFQLPALIAANLPLMAPVMVTGLFIAPRNLEPYSHKRFAQVASELAAETGQSLWYLNDLGDWRWTILESIDIAESLWFYMREPPQAAGSPDELVKRLSDGPARLLLMITPRQQAVLESDPRLATRVVLEEPWVQRPPALVVEASLVQAADR